MSDTEVIIGLEVHIQLTNLKTKLFCSCNSDYRGKEQNTIVCPICLGLPGSLPVINENAIGYATRLALALDCKINEEFWFFRKNYFYPDLPKAFQISQYNKAGGKAFGDGGHITIRLDGEKKEISLDRIHLEEDPARLVHKGSIASSPYTLVDYNRSGMTLIEIVTNPVMKSPEEARDFLNQLKSIVQYTGIADLDLEGSVRVDANISIKGNPRSEVKNINSFKEVERALKWEIQRQRNALKRGKELIQETRHWDDKRRVTIGLRTKEFEKDYRYFPEQDLVPINIDKKFIEEVKKELPEMPNARMKRFQEQYQLSEFDSEILVLDKNLADFFEKGVQQNKSFGLDDYKTYCNWLMGDISRWLNDNNKNINDSKLKSNQLNELIMNINDGKITGKIAKGFVDEMMKGNSISDIIKKSGKKRIADEATLYKIVEEVLKENLDIVKDYNGNPRALEALIGKCMQKTRGQADPNVTRNLIKKKIQ
ncbi:MAG: Asp-tRNA(Asn)/Glu-tRNA(Gln) amidotransferase subunit GatB [Candidatus Lokiarchaeota archaeon]|nr:Asp-tRNA(Asn)/Glu-tRNA(Gln) amidotransferase subunit GatB [Candidatus Lokiarchaeota archaeon]